MTTSPPWVTLSTARRFANPLAAAFPHSPRDNSGRSSFSDNRSDEEAAMSLRILAGPEAGRVIVETIYNPASLTTLDTPALSTADEDVDATNLVITGIVPASGRIRVRLNAAASSVTAGASVHWMLRTTGGATVAGTKVRVAVNTTVVRPAYDVQIAGLTPGATFTYRWGQSTDNSTNKARLYCGDAGGTTVHGPASMIATVG